MTYRVFAGIIFERTNQHFPPSLGYVKKHTSHGKNMIPANTLAKVESMLLGGNATLFPHIMPALQQKGKHISGA